jgi:hypothetical protein
VEYCGLLQLLDEKQGRFVVLLLGNDGGMRETDMFISHDLKFQARAQPKA